jgi:hypothetical protein
MYVIIIFKLLLLFYHILKFNYKLQFFWHTCRMLCTVNQTINHNKNLIYAHAGAQHTLLSLWKYIKVKYGIRARGVTNFLERQLQE